ncbi:MAG: hypothetical protein ACO331_05170, partial [Prochlorothrix sp.]
LGLSLPSSPQKMVPPLHRVYGVAANDACNADRLWIKLTDSIDFPNCSIAGELIKNFAVCGEEVDRLAFL